MPLIPKSIKKRASEVNPIKVMLDLYGAYQLSVFRHHFNLLIKMTKENIFNSEITPPKEAIRQWFRDSLSRKVVNEEQYKELNTILNIIENVASPEEIDEFYTKFNFDPTEGMYRSNRDENFSDDENKPRTLGDLCEIKINFENPDFWLKRKGSIQTVGEPTKEFNPENIGIKVKPEFLDLVEPRFLYYWFVSLHGMGGFQEISKGTTSLVNIKADDIKKIKFSF